MTITGFDITSSLPRMSSRWDFVQGGDFAQKAVKTFGTSASEYAAAAGLGE